MIPKFRAWLPDPDVKKMLRVKALIFENDKTRCMCGYAYDFYLEDEDAILMQSTGLHDKNGKEIFEGDTLASEIYPVNGAVEYRAKLGMWVNCLKEYSYYEYLGNVASNREIIGNIYENPELLEVE